MHLLRSTYRSKGDFSSEIVSQSKDHLDTGRGLLLGSGWMAVRDIPQILLCSGFQRCFGCWINGLLRWFLPRSYMVM